MKKLALATMLVAFACGLIHAQDAAAPAPDAKAPCVKKCCHKKKGCPKKAECPEKKCCPAKAACPGKK